LSLLLRPHAHYSVSLPSSFVFSSTNIIDDDIITAIIIIAIIITIAITIINSSIHLPDSRCTEVKALLLHGVGPVVSCHLQASTEAA
jgi:hypothetical protein